VTLNEIIDFLFEGDKKDTSKVMMDRMILRLFSSPALISQLKNVALVERNGDQIIQLAFNELPKARLGEIMRLIGFRDIQVVEFESNGISHTGFEIKIPREGSKNPLLA
jgi:hypothetical protein